MKKSIDSGNSKHTSYEVYLESIVDTIREALLVLDKEFRVISANKTFYNKFKVKPEETEGKLVYELGNGQWNISDLKILLEEILPAHNPFNNFRVEHDFPNIGKKVMLLNARQIKESGRWKDRILLAIEDITSYDKDRVEKETFIEREHNALRELKSSQDRFKAIIEHNYDAIVLNNAEGKITYASPAFQKIFGYNTKNVLKINPVKLIHKDDLSLALKSFETVKTNPKKIVKAEYRVLHKKGNYVWVEGTLSNQLNNPSIEAIVINLRDINKKKNDEEQLEALNKKLNDKVKELETLIELVPIGIGISEDPKGTKIHINKLFREMLRVRPGANASKTAPISQELDFKVVRSGKEVPGDDLPMQKAGITGKPVYGDIIDIVHQDGTVINLLSYAVPIFDDKGNVRIIVGAFLDITERKRLEQQKDDFLGIASHELKTPVTSIKAYGQVLQTLFKRKGDTKAVESLQKMDAQINKLTNLIGDLLDVTKIQSGRLEFHEDFFDFNELVEEIVDEMQLTTEKHSLVKKLDKSYKVFGDRDRIGQVITNLISNAIKYSPHNNKINIISEYKKGNIILCVQDFGVGIPREKQGQVFNQFFRVSGPSHNTVPGMGLGLYISSQIIKRLSGEIWVESQEGKGSSFYFSIPVSKKRNITKNNLAEEEMKHD